MSRVALSSKCHKFLQRSHPHLLRALILLGAAAVLGLVLFGRDASLVILCVVVAAILLVISKAWRVPE